MPAAQTHPYQEFQRRLSALQPSVGQAYSQRYPDRPREQVLQNQGWLRDWEAVQRDVYRQQHGDIDEAAYGWAVQQALPHAPQGYQSPYVQAQPAFQTPQQHQAYQPQRFQTPPQLQPMTEFLMTRMRGERTPEDELQETRLFNRGRERIEEGYRGRQQQLEESLQAQGLSRSGVAAAQIGQLNEAQGREIAGVSRDVSIEQYNRRRTEQMQAQAAMYDTIALDLQRQSQERGYDLQALSMAQQYQQFAQQLREGARQFDTRFGLESELGRGQLDLQREMGRGQLGLDQRRVDDMIQRGQFADLFQMQQHMSGEQQRQFENAFRVAMAQEGMSQRDIEFAMALMQMYQRGELGGLGSYLGGAGQQAGLISQTLEDLLRRQPRTDWNRIFGGIIQGLGTLGEAAASR